MQYFTAAEISRELNMPPTTISYWIKKGYLKPDKILASGKKKFSEKTVNRLKDDAGLND